MTQQVEPILLLTFGTMLGRHRTLRINNLSSSLNHNNVRGAMDAMIHSNSIAGASGSINSRRRATLVRTTVTPFTFD